jgi:hypothetical protein
MAMVIAGSVSWPMLFFFGTYTLPLSNSASRLLNKCRIKQDQIRYVKTIEQS